MKLLKRYMDDDFIFFPLKLNLENIKTCLNKTHSSMIFPFEKPEIIYKSNNKVQVSSFLDVKTILHEENPVETDIYYKPTNSHDNSHNTITYHTIAHTLIISKVVSHTTYLKELEYLYLILRPLSSI